MQGVSELCTYFYLFTMDFSVSFPLLLRVPHDTAITPRPVMQE